MANITEVSQWESIIRQIENGEAATGGADGLANVQAKQLANRTQWLKDNYLPLAGGALTGNALTWNGNDLAGSAIVAKSLKDEGYVKYASGLIIQWGHYYIPGGSNVTKGTLGVILPISFPNKILNVVANHITDSTTNQAIISVVKSINTGFSNKNKFTLSFEITPKSTPNTVVYGGGTYIAIGY